MTFSPPPSMIYVLIHVKGPETLPAPEHLISSLLFNSVTW